MDAQELRDRSKQFALRIIRLFRALPNNTEAQVIGRQLLRSGTSLAANYRAVCRAKSHADFVAKLGIVIEEADESAFWLELLGDASIIRQPRLADLTNEVEELISIFVASRETARRQRT